MTDSVVVIGAGVAGLAAARHLRHAGVRTTLIEAAPRMGGRAWTTGIGQDPFDHGASWLHDAERNPSVSLAIQDDRLRRSGDRDERVFIDGRPATPAETAAYHAAWDELDQVVGPALNGPDTTLAAAMAPMAANPWARLVAQWEGAIIAAADATDLGLRDWHRNRLDGTNMVAPAGIGAYIARHLATPVRLNTPATRIIWSGPGVQVEAPEGTVQADAAIITVSTGVLAANAIAFDPPLPHDVLTAIHNLPMGLLSKVALPATGTGRLGLPDGALLVGQGARMTFNAWHQARAHITGFIGGRLAWDVAPDPRAAEALARSELATLLGQDALKSLAPAADITDWGTNPLFRGAYAYAGPGNAQARATLAHAFPAQRLIFAGEAPRTDGLAGTVAGAYLSGVEAAERLTTPSNPERASA